MVDNNGRREIWSAPLCDETYEEIFDRMTVMLKDKYFTLVICNSYSETDETFQSVEVKTSRKLDGPIRRWLSDSNLGLSWTITGYTMGAHTNARTQKAARNGHKLDCTIFSFDRDTITLDLYAPAGYALRWIMAVERHDEVTKTKLTELDDAVCDALQAVKHDHYDGRDVESHLKALLEKIRKEM